MAKDGKSHGTTIHKGILFQFLCLIVSSLVYCVGGHLNINNKKLLYKNIPGRLLYIISGFHLTD